MPTATILGTHLCNAYEVTRMNEMIAAGQLEVTAPTVVPWDGAARGAPGDVGQPHAGANYVVNHALPGTGLRSRDELYRGLGGAEAAAEDDSHGPTEAAHSARRRDGWPARWR